MSLPKLKFPRARAIQVAQEIVTAIKPLCIPGYLRVAGSLRREKSEVGDVEIVYVPAVKMVPDGLFDTRPTLPFDEMLERLIADGVTRKVVTGAIISEEDQNEPTLMRFHEQNFATALGMAIIQNPPKDGD